MKRTFILVMILTAIVVSSCSKKSDDTTTGPTSSTLAKVGTTWGSNGDGTITVTQVSGSDVIINATSGGTTLAIGGSMTTTGFADYFYSNGDKSKPFTLVNFSDAVGTQYKFNIGSSQVVRTIVSVSTTNDLYVPALQMSVKASVVQEDVPAGLTVNGKITKTRTIYWALNHKFGVVFARVYFTDGTSKDFPLTTTNAGTK
ncbi:MAG: hypothetical protein WCO02_03520 [Bacteroidota bacterium]